MKRKNKVTFMRGVGQLRCCSALVRHQSSAPNKRKSDKSPCKRPVDNIQQQSNAKFQTVFNA